MSDDESDSDGGRVSVDVGGRVFETSASTLLVGGGSASYFGALLGSGRAGEQMRGRKRARVSADAPLARSRTLFVDRDPDLFADVLQFLRSSRIPAAARKNEDRLEDLRGEAEFFCLDALAAACDRAIQALAPPEETARSEVFLCRPRYAGSPDPANPVSINVPKGQVVFIQAVTPLGFENVQSLAVCNRSLLAAEEDLLTTQAEKVILIAISKSNRDTAILQRPSLTFGGGESDILEFHCYGEEEPVPPGPLINGWQVAVWIGHPSKIPALAARSSG
mmetsp:Transcript_2262/g.6688  ORF Transcript_2262/g.6688 Transcript_2262/m.6688 type:complete len:278 (-) Transcript_2262:61-894(-)